MSALTWSILGLWLLALCLAYPSKRYTYNDDDTSMQEALLALQRQRRQMADTEGSYMDPALADYLYNIGYAPGDEKGYYPDQQDGSYPVSQQEEPEESKYDAVINEILRRIQDKQISKTNPVDKSELNDIFSKPDNLDYSDFKDKRSDKKSDEEGSLEDSKKDESVTTQHVSDGELQDLFSSDEDVKEENLLNKDNIEALSNKMENRKQNIGVKKRSQGSAMKIMPFVEIRDEGKDAETEEMSISLDQLKQDLLAEENKHLMDALDLATLAQIDGDPNYIPTEIEAIQKAIKVEEIIQAINRHGKEQQSNEAEEESYEKRNSANEKSEPVLNRIHHAETTGTREDGDKTSGYDVLPWKQDLPYDNEDSANIDECPVPMYDFSCEYAAEFGDEFVDLCQRHDICYTCGGVHGIPRSGCDDGFLGEAEELCQGDERCKLAAAKMFIYMEKDHRRVPDSDDLQECTNDCVESYIVFGLAK